MAKKKGNKASPKGKSSKAKDPKTETAVKEATALAMKAAKELQEAKERSEAAKAVEQEAKAELDKMSADKAQAQSELDNAKAKMDSAKNEMLAAERESWEEEKPAQAPKSIDDMVTTLEKDAANPAADDYVGLSDDEADAALERLNKNDDLTIDKDGGVIKTIITKSVDDAKADQDDKTPTAGATCEVCLTAAVHEGETFINNKKMTLRLDDAEVPEGLDIAIRSMEKGEKSFFEVRSDYGYSRWGSREHNVEPETHLDYTIELLSFTNLKKTWELSEQEKNELVTRHKTVGNQLFKLGQFKKAQERYEQALQDSEYDEPKDEDCKKELKALRISSGSNLAMCCLKLEQYDKAEKACDKVLTVDADNAKALFRRAQARRALGNPTDAKKDCLRACKLMPTDVAARKLLAEIKAVLKKEADKEKKLFGGFFGKVNLVTKKEEEERRKQEEERKKNEKFDDMSDDSDDTDVEVVPDDKPETENTEAETGEA